MPNEETSFATTRWNVVLEAADAAAPDGVAAFNELCLAYWKPLYVYLRRSGLSVQDAEDVTQGFLTHLLTHQGLRSVAPHKGRFRSFLLVSLKNFLANERDRARTCKRGGGAVQVALGNVGAERDYQLEPVDDLSPDRLYERHWAHTVLSQARKCLRAEYAENSRIDRFQCLEGFLPGEQPAVSQAVAARWLGTSEGTFRVELHRFRHRYCEMIRAEVARTVGSHEEIDQELRHLIRIVSEEPGSALNGGSLSLRAESDSCG